MTTQPRFEDRLLAQLRRVVAESPDPVPTPVPHRRHVPRARLALAGVSVAAAATVAVIAATGGSVTPNAWAVEPGPHGEVTVAIRGLEDADGLQHRLRAAGVPAVVDYVPNDAHGCVAGGPVPGRAGGAAIPGPASGVAVGGTEARGDEARGDEAGATEVHSTRRDDGPSFSRSGSDPAPTDGPHGTGVGGPSTGKVTSRVTAGASGHDGAMTFSIDPGTLQPGQKVYITTSSGAVSSVSMAIGTTTPSTACAPGSPAP
jgi:hypothetical protein